MFLYCQSRQILCSRAKSDSDWKKISLVKHHCFSPQQLLASVWWRWTPAQCWNHFAPIQMERRRTPMKALSWPLVTWPRSLQHKRNKQNGSKKQIHSSRKFKVTQKMYNVSVSQWFSIPVLTPPPLCIFRMLLLSLQMFVLLERKCPAKWTSQDIPPWFQFETIVYIPFKVHISVQDVN